MLKNDHRPVNVIHQELQGQETSQIKGDNSYEINIFQGKLTHKQISEQNPKTSIRNSIISLNAKEEVESVNSQNSLHSQDMDIDEQNDIVNDLSYIEQLQKTDEQDEMFSNLSAKQRILYANTKKHQGNEHFRENNLEQAIQAYKFGLSLLKPQSFAIASTTDCLLMAELTSNILYNMGTCYFILMSFRYAIKLYDQAIMIKPNYVKAIHNRALSHMEEGNLLSAYNDIKLAYKYDKNNLSIQNDMKKIEESYYSAYRHHSLSKEESYLNFSDDKILSKSMILNNVNDFTVQQQQLADTSISMIKREQNIHNSIQIIRLSLQKSPVKSQKIEQTVNTNPKQRVKSFYSKKFYRNQLQKNTKATTKTTTSVMNSPKFRPYILNKTSNYGNRLPNFLQPKMTEKQSLQNSAGQLFERQKRITLLQDKINESPSKTKQNSKKKRNKSKQKRDKNGQDNFWGYIPIFVATGFGLYHSLRAVLGK